MQIKLTFLGAAQCVTGSRYLIEVNNRRYLVDCGLYQERDLRVRNWDRFPVPPQTIDGVLLTHAHIDHCGLLPKLVHEGLSCPVYGTAANNEVTQIMLLDSARVQQEDAEFKKKRHERERRNGPYPETPLYTTNDVNACVQLLSPVSYGQTIEIGDGIHATFYDAGHVLGSSMIKLNVKQDGEERTVIFSGDIGRWDKPILQDPTLFEQADYVMVESTYGDRLLQPVEEAANDLAEVINATAKAGGNVVIPSFALERSQDVLFYIGKFIAENRIPRLLVFVDSPMAVNITDVFGHHPQILDEDMARLIQQKKAPFDFPGLNLVRTTEESKAINHIKGTIIVIAGSGMCTGGRIKHHLATNISRRDSTILFVGYQATGTLGRQIIDGARHVRILGQHYRIRAKVRKINGLSAHADKDQLFKWLSSLKSPPRGLFVTHGETITAHNFAKFVRDKTDWNISVPAYRDSVTLS